MIGVEVNVYSDASVRKEGAAWGCVIVRPGRRAFEASGRFASETTYKASTMVAELKAAANAIHAALKAGLIKPGDRVVVRSDNQSAVQWIEARGTFKRGRTNNRADCNEVVDWIVEKATARGFEVGAAWVPGHQRADSPDPHARHNRRADSLCACVARTHGKRKSAKRPGKRERIAAAAE
jgi:ribonuclease HI